MRLCVCKYKWSYLLSRCYKGFFNRNVTVLTKLCDDIYIREYAQDQFWYLIILKTGNVIVVYREYFPISSGHNFYEFPGFNCGIIEDSGL